MKYKQFRIKNFKGIEDMTFDLDKSPDANIYTLVGLNESGKTTILEAMNLFKPSHKELDEIEIPGSSVIDFNELIPISKRDNFDEKISIEVTLTLEEQDKKEINKYLYDNTDFRKIEDVDKITYFRYFNYKDSKYSKLEKKWTGFNAFKKTNSKKSVSIFGANYTKVNIALAGLCSKLIPNILYFPNFLFEFPSQILLETKGGITTSKEDFYIHLVQDILNSLDNKTNINTHLIERIKSGDKNDKKSLQRLIQLMEKKITEVIFEAWSTIFKRRILDAKVVINYGIDEKDNAYLEFAIEANDGIYQINERSLGFRWFFIFLLFTQFRPFRKDSPKGIIFLFDEPASNLHPLAQAQLLKSFENLIGNGKIIYTTHSHHLINPRWLESTYVVRNEGLKLDKMEEYDNRKTNIVIQSYKQFAAAHPHNTAYFQPILDVLDYTPSNLENVPDCIFLEGKNDYYTLMYFKEVILQMDMELNMSPSTSSSNMDVLISLYIGWSKKFLVVLDSDKEGKTQEARYKESFGISVEDKIVTLEHIDSNWKRTAMEKLFKDDELLAFQKSVYEDTTEFNKTHFNRSIQECLAKKQKFEFSDETKENFRKTLLFLHEKIS